MKKLFLAMLTAFTLSACGGGGSDVKTNQSVNQVIIYQTNKDGTALNFNQKPQTAAGNDGTHFTTLKIGNRSIPLDNGEIYQTRYGDKLILSEGDDYLSLSFATTYARFGIAGIAGAIGQPDKLAFFYQGNPTPIADMEKQKGNNVKYTGDAIAVRLGDYNIETMNGAEELANNIFVGRTNLTVDFDEKKINGNIGNWQGYGFANDVDIKADIKANTFTGTANSTGAVEGKFYGANAQNMAGAFHDKSQKLQGIFGGTKQ